MLEEATKEAFGYYASELTHGSNKPILAACETCGEFRVISKQSYRIFCNSCSMILGGKMKGKNHLSS